MTLLDYIADRLLNPQEDEMFGPGRVEPFGAKTMLCPDEEREPEPYMKALPRTKFGKPGSGWWL